MATLDVEEVVEPTAFVVVPHGSYTPPFFTVDTRTFIPEANEAGLGAPEEVPADVAYIIGQVVDIEGDGCSRAVYALRRTDGTRVGQTQSGSDGTFTIYLKSADPCILFAVPLDGEQLNAVVLDNILPVPT